MRTEVLCTPGLSVSRVKLRGEADPGRAQASAKRGMRGPRVGRLQPAGAPVQVARLLVHFHFLLWLLHVSDE